MHRHFNARHAHAHVFKRAMSISISGFESTSDAYVVETRYGPITVTVQGDRSKPPLMTFHDVGLNHRTCFQPLFVCAGTSSDLLRRFCIYHIDAPGCEDGGAGLEYAPCALLRDGETLDALAERCEDVATYFGLTNVTVLGVGAGATVMALYAGRHASPVVAAMLISPSCTRASTMEHVLGAAAKFNLRRYGWTSWSLQHLMKRMFSYRALAGGSGGLFGSDLACTAKREMSELNAKAVLAYYEAALNRLDNTHIYEHLDIDAIILAGTNSPWYKDTLHMNAVMRPRKVAWIEMEGCGTVVTMEDPTCLLSPINLFIQRLKSEGVC
jgi:pimeloyl-ACP methyl ester carboxylesterase